jgi:hypothetical protein
VQLERRAAEVEISGLPQSPPAPSLKDLPNAAWLALAAGDTGRTIAAALATFTPQLDDAEQATGLDFDDDVLPHLGPGSFFIQGTQYTDLGARLLAETKDERALQRAAVRFARRMGARAELYKTRPGADERIVQVSWSRRGSQDELFDDYWVEIRGGRFILETGQATGGVAGALSDTPRWKDAVRRLGGEPTLLIDLISAERVVGDALLPLTYVAARITPDGVLRAALVGGRP